MSAEESAQANDGSEPGLQAGLQAEIAGLTAERDKLSSEKADLHDLLLRHQAEFNNFRRRTERDRSDFVQYAGMDLVRELLPVLDDFERALQADSGSKDYAKGVELIYQRMYDSLKKIGLEPIDTTGQIFDPHLHQAVEKVKTNDAEDHAILGEFQRGYHFKGKLLRPSMVKVAVRP
ncbi:MAG: nucleotide exchange factor GrpE [Acidobacteriota bacterium]|nr:nucleotide exchange factor GrpE [Acidobacteriota bacterium]